MQRAALVSFISFRAANDGGGQEEGRSARREAGASGGLKGLSAFDSANSGVSPGFVGLSDTCLSSVLLSRIGIRIFNSRHSDYSTIAPDLVRLE